ncbi:MAG: GIY-YIG nuclease family protein, partial [Candidatus Levybacteria bacterium]|nr:GIY-YIG nuclease family protein [Candidatus Levybacteria bacterium]
MWFVYALYNSEAGKIYIGETSDIERRLTEHNKKRGNHYTAKVGGIWELIYKEKVEDRKRALIREKQLKSYRGREFIKKYILKIIFRGSSTVEQETVNFKV